MTVWRVAGGIWKAMAERDLALISAGVAFYAMLAIFPGLAAVIALWGLAADPAEAARQIELVYRLMPESVALAFDAQLSALIAASGRTLGWTTALSIAAAIWSARAGVAALMRGLNAIHGVQNRGGVQHAAVAVLLTVSLVITALVAISSVVVAPLALALLPLAATGGLVFEGLRWLVAATMMLFGLGMVYRYGPNRDEHVRTPWISAGSVLALLVWGAASLGFSYYLANFGNYNEVYGSIGAAIALLMWLFIGAYVVLLGAVLNRVLAAQRARSRAKAPA